MKNIEELYFPPIERVERFCPPLNLHDKQTYCFLGDDWQTYYLGYNSTLGEYPYFISTSRTDEEFFRTYEAAVDYAKCLFLGG